MRMIMIVYFLIEVNIFEGFCVKLFYVDDGLYILGKRWERREVIKVII